MGPLTDLVIAAANQAEAVVVAERASGHRPTLECWGEVARSPIEDFPAILQGLRGCQGAR